jgi:hypothetical protein
MGVADIASVALKDPGQASLLVLQRLKPDWLVDRLEKLGAKAGLSRPAFLLSFDCDTDRDIALSWDVHTRLRGMGITPVYAVPGELLERGQDVWRRIGDSGAEFINHGFRCHTVYRDGQYVSNVFYDQMSPAEIEGDIVKGHDAILNVIGRRPEGFRAPHFATFNDEAQLRLLHAILVRLGYRYSSSTTPYVALRYGPHTGRFGLPELPVTGCVDYPMTILDSYTFRFAGGRLKAADYIAQANAWAAQLTAGRRFFVNLYADPSQVADWPDFFEAMERLAPFALPNYDAVLREFRQ